jgi:hypothetical protein
MRRWLAATAVLALAACGSSGAGSSGGAVEAKVAGGSGLIEVRDVECRYNGTNQLTATGVVTSRGESVSYVNISVRFIDGDGVRFDIASDSVSDLQPGEAARWDASVYGDKASSVVRCEVAAKTS